MKKLIVTGLLTLGGITLQAQAQNPLAGTAWQGQAYGPDKMTIIMHFKADTVAMLIPPSMFAAETMVYTVKGDTLTLRKTSGNSPCDTVGMGTLHFAVKSDEMTMKVLTDDCPARKASFIDEPFRKVAIPAK